MLVHIVPHATDLGISAVTAASILATMGGVSIVGMIVMGIVADRIGNMQVFIIGFARDGGSFVLVSVSHRGMDDLSICCYLWSCLSG